MNKDFDAVEATRTTDLGRGCGGKALRPNKSFFSRAADSDRFDAPIRAKQCRTQKPARKGRCPSGWHDDGLRHNPEGFALAKSFADCQNMGKRSNCASATAGDGAGMSATGSNLSSGSLNAAINRSAVKVVCEADFRPKHPSEQMVPLDALRG
jgi:hypothetical protein